MLFQNDIASSFFVWLFISLQLLTSIGYHVVTIDYRGTVLFWYFTLWFDKLSVTIQYKCRFTCIWMYENFKPLDWRILKEVISLNSWLFSWEGTLETHLLEKQPLMEYFFLNNLWKILRMSTFQINFYAYLSVPNSLHVSAEYFSSQSDAALLFCRCIFPLWFVHLTLTVYIKLLKQLFNTKKWQWFLVSLPSQFCHF